jgi:hypothetical protein
MDKPRRRFFNTTGPCNPADHYMLPPADRLVGAQLHRYIRDKLYWVLHAPRQTGKTTFLQSWMREINAGDEALACYVSVERCQGIPEPERAMPDLCKAVQEYAGWTGFPVPELKTRAVNSMLSEVLSDWARLTAPRPLVVLFDEVNVLEGDALISFLRQLRGGFAGRGIGTFPTSVALVGMRDLKDYITAAKGGVPVNPGSPFNIKADSASLANFSREDIEHLFAQRTEDTGQGISAEALDYVYGQSRGQPWIVNNLFMRATMRILADGDTRTVGLEQVEAAREQMIRARETHLDALARRLEDPRIRGVMETLMTGEPDIRLAAGEPFRLCVDLGLVSIERGSPAVANPIYREVLAREMTFGAQMAIPEPRWKWEKADGRLDMEALLREFQVFWRNHSEVWEGQAEYREAFPHLLLMAFMQRVTNGSGRIEREYAAGRGRMDLAVEYHGGWDIVEVKLLRGGRSFEAVAEEGVGQALGYRDIFSKACGGPRGGDPPGCYLVIFDRRPLKPSWDERLRWFSQDGVTVAGC